MYSFILQSEFLNRPLKPILINLKSVTMNYSEAVMLASFFTYFNATSGYLYTSSHLKVLKLFARPSQVGNFEKSPRGRFFGRIVELFKL